MSETGPDGLPPQRDDVAALEAQEQELRRMLGDEDEYLVDLVQSGMDAHDFTKTPAGMALFSEQHREMRAAIAVLRDPAKSDAETLKAAYRLRVSYAAVDIVASAIVAGHRAERAIDEKTTGEEGP